MAQKIFSKERYAIAYEAVMPGEKKYDIGTIMGAFTQAAKKAGFRISFGMACGEAATLSPEENISFSDMQSVMNAVRGATHYSVFLSSDADLLGDKVLNSPQPAAMVKREAILKAEYFPP